LSIEDLKGGCMEHISSSTGWYQDFLVHKSLKNHFQKESSLSFIYDLTDKNVFQRFFELLIKWDKEFVDQDFIKKLIDHNLTILKLLNLKYLLEILGEENFKGIIIHVLDKDEHLLDYIDKEMNPLSVNIVYAKREDIEK
jgi:hypothetical protein